MTCSQGTEFQSGFEVRTAVSLGLDARWMGQGSGSSNDQDYRGVSIGLTGVKC